MHSVHFPDKSQGPEEADTIAGALGILFSVEDYNVELDDA
jgi:hypothetical protein